MSNDDMPENEPVSADAMVDSTLQRLLDDAVARLRSTRRTFTEDEALAQVWDAGYDVSPGIDPRFILAREADGTHPRHWRLYMHAVANDRLLDALNAGTWDGHDLDAELTRLDAEDGNYYVFCPIDTRFVVHPNGAIEPADREINVRLAQATKARLDTLGPDLLEQWHADGNAPWTVRQITEVLGRLGWSEAGTRTGWQFVRAWLLGWNQAVRVGPDYWLPIGQIPVEPKHNRLQVLPVHSSSEKDTSPALPDDSGEETTVQPGSNTPLTFPSSRIPSNIELVQQTVSWTVVLRTANLIEGLLHVPKQARRAYPPRGVGQGATAILRGRWFETDESLWLWLDRTHDMLYGPDLSRQLEWCDAGTKLHIEWSPNIVILRIAGYDANVELEESRLVDVEALKEVRGGLGESYCRSLQTILEGAPAGLRFAELLGKLRQRQGHPVHSGTVRSILAAGGFIQHNGRWYAAPQQAEGARTLRSVLLETLLRTETTTEPEISTVRLRKQAEYIRHQLTHLITQLHDISR